MIYYTGDQHFGHSNIIRFCNRPFVTVAEMDEALIKNWNNVVSNDDMIIFLVIWCSAVISMQTII